MMRRKRALAVVLVPLLLSVAPSRAQERTETYEVVRGNWTITAKNIENDEWVTKYVEINQNRTQLSGRFQGPNQQGGIEGFVNGHHIEFSTKTRDVLTFRGEVDGNQMSGNYGLHGRHAPFKAVRTNPTPTQ
jgi:hypothetical protein